MCNHCIMHQNSLYENIERKISSIKYSSSLVVFRKSRPFTLSCYFLIAKSSLHSRKTSTFCKFTKVTGTSQKSCYPLTEYLHQSSHHEMYWWHMPLKVLTFIMIFHYLEVPRYNLLGEDFWYFFIFADNNSKISLDDLHIQIPRKKHVPS